MRVIRTIGSAILWLLGIVIGYLTIIIFGPGFTVPKQPLRSKGGRKSDSSTATPPNRKDVTFTVEGDDIRGWLYLPEDIVDPVPCIVLCTGFGGTKGMILEQYALKFQQVGIAALIFDYRYFGESDGEPRQLFLIANQLDDCRAAVEFARRQPEIDGDRIGIWGTSAGGGYGLTLAATDERIAAVCGQCAALDSHIDGQIALEREGYGFFLRLFVHAQRDMGRSRFGLTPHRIPIVGKPGSLAFVTARGAFEGYSALASPDFVNEVCARVLLRTGGHSPMTDAKNVECPVLLCMCEKDKLVSMEAAENTMDNLGELGTLKRYPIDHFEIYVGEHFEQAVADQVAFFGQHFGVM